MKKEKIKKFCKKHKIKILVGLNDIILKDFYNKEHIDNLAKEMIEKTEENR